MTKILGISIFKMVMALLFYIIYMAI